MSDSSFPVIYQLKVVLLGISPMIWRRLQVSSDSTIFRFALHTIAETVRTTLETFLLVGKTDVLEGSYALISVGAQAPLEKLIAYVQNQEKPK